MKLWTVVLVGNPNGGKSTLFNALTGSHQEVGNWCGVTVEKKRGWFQIGDGSVEVLDLPGCYHISPDPESPIDEQITAQYLESNEADLLVNVVDATNLERHLFLTLQLLEKGKPVIVALNMMDAAKKQNIHIDVQALAKRLGCPVVAMIAVQGQGIKVIKEMIKDSQLQTHTHSPWPFLGSDPVEIAKARYLIIHNIIQAVVRRPKTLLKTNWTERIDRIVLNRFLGIPIFLIVMYSVFMFAIEVSGNFQNYLEIASRLLFIEGPERVLSNLQCPKWVVTLLVFGVGQGINTTVSFIPVIAGMFLSLSFLEASGYMARAAFVMDKVMQWVGLPGKSFVPMIIGFGCNVPAVMASRTLENYRERVLTILMSPFMSCGARLAIYALFVSAFFPTGGQNIIFGLYLIGILVALLSGFLLRTTVLSGERSSLIIELPPYRFPSIKSLWKSTFLRVKRFVLKAGVLIIALFVLIGTWGMVRTYTGTNDGLASFGRFMTPLFAPMGIEKDNWPATVGLFTGILAKEVVVGTLSALYVQDESDVRMSSGKLGVMVAKFGSQTAAFAYLLFLLLYFPCVSVVAAISRELNPRWAIFSVIWTTGIAYVTAVLFYQFATFSFHPKSSIAWIVGIIGVLVSCLYVLKKQIQRRNKTRRALPTQILVLDS